ncbi:curli production assembly/transport protein CsgE [Pseudomonas citronellolis]|jgi:curli production assembly/transport component CsgE|uniref:curli production assembly/transport protein CsgE n=1 Tax=Pseudomonas citronellolis TaxID=53408 RepID=UPI00226F3DF6|nr:curli production assembly/transport protein CsgE [Pseudomonas citronellolis]WAB90366.1 curli production assembly/transport protein CsgE [Pseudomonas citronellolis]
MNPALALLLCLLLLTPTSGRAGEEDELNGFIVDDTISHIGHDFYRFFSERLRDSSRLDFNLVVRERPSARWGSLVWVEFQQRVLYREFLAPNTAELKTVAYAAADRVAQAVVRQRLENLLQDTTDIERDEL